MPDLTPNQLETTQHWLDQVPEKVELTSFERQKVLDLMEAPGFALLLGVLLAERGGQFHSIRNLKADGEEGWRRLGVLQGTITGIDRAHQILLECSTVPTDAQGN